MRILSQSEFEAVGAQKSIPIDLEQQYFPVQLRAYSWIDGKSVNGSTYALESKFLEEILNKVACKIGAEKIWLIERVGQDGYRWMKEVSSEHSWYSMQFGVESERNQARTLLSLFPISHLVFSDMLKEQDIPQRPGYLYFAAAVPKINQWGPTNLRGSSIYGFSDLSTWQGYLRRAEESDAITLERLQREQKHGQVQSSRKKVRQGKKEPEEIHFEREVEKLRPWKGEIEDIAHCTNSRVVKTAELEESVHYILETPLEYPRGFVRETAMLLKREWNATSKLVEEFCTLCFEKPNDIPVKGHKDAEISFPLGETSMTGPDFWWRYSKNPWLVQTILLARLIGGDFWQYALSNLEGSSPEYLALDL